MVRISITEAKAKLLSLVDDVQAGEEIEITRHGKPVARLVPPLRSSHAFIGSLIGRATQNCTDEELYSTGEKWDAS